VSGSAQARRRRTPPRPCRTLTAGAHRRRPLVDPRPLWRTLRRGAGSARCASRPPRR